MKKEFIEAIIERLRVGDQFVCHLHNSPIKMYGRVLTLNPDYIEADFTFPPRHGRDVILIKHIDYILSVRDDAIMHPIEISIKSVSGLGTVDYLLIRPRFGKARVMRYMTSPNPCGHPDAEFDNLDKEIQRAFVFFLGRYLIEDMNARAHLDF